MNESQAIEMVPYHAALGVAVEELNEESAHLVLLFKAENSNPGNILHGGVTASMVAIGGMTVAQRALGNEAGPFYTCGFTINYLSAAIGKPIFTSARLLRKGKDLAYVDIGIMTEDEKLVANGSVIVRGRFNAEPAGSVLTRGDDGFSEPGPMGTHLPQRVAFIGKLGMQVENMSQGQARIAMPFVAANGDDQGNVHEGAILALIDTAGAMAAWAETGVGPYKASTIGVQAQIRAASGHEDLIAYGRLRQRDREIFWSEVEVAVAKTREVVAGGMVIYRLVQG